MELRAYTLSAQRTPTRVSRWRGPARRARRSRRGLAETAWPGIHLYRLRIGAQVALGPLTAFPQSKVEVNVACPTRVLEFRQEQERAPMTDTRYRVAIVGAGRMGGLLEDEKPPNTSCTGRVWRFGAIPSAGFE